MHGITWRSSALSLNCLLLLHSSARGSLVAYCRVWTAGDGKTQRTTRPRRANERARPQPRAARAQLGHAAVLHWWPTARCHTSVIYLCALMDSTSEGPRTSKASVQAQQTSWLQQSPPGLLRGLWTEEVIGWCCCTAQGDKGACARCRCQTPSTATAACKRGAHATAGQRAWA